MKSTKSTTARSKKRASGSAQQRRGQTVKRRSGTGSRRTSAKPVNVKLQRILVPVDFSDRSRKTLKYAAAFARLHGAKLTLLHVVEPMVYPAEIGFAPGSLESVELTMRDTAKARLQEWAEKEVPEDIQAEIRMQVGNAYREITNTARKEKADMIIISTHGYTGLTHVLLGSTAERVVRHAACPVLTLHKGDIR